MKPCWSRLSEWVRVTLTLEGNVTPVSDIETGNAGPSPGHFIVAGGKPFFTATTTALGREVWVLTP